MQFYVENGYTSLIKKNEELCGDKVEICVKDHYTTLVLADGLGSGVKANILATLTSKILCTMVSNDISINDCLETIIQSLPVCKERGVAYSTFSVIHVSDDGCGYLFEFDNPQAILIRNNCCFDLKREKLEIQGKIVYQSNLRLQENDIVLTMSDGAIYAGVGETMNFGWQRPEIISFLNEQNLNEYSAKYACCLLASACNDLYIGKPGDDTTVAAIKVRKALHVNVLVGPPVDKRNDDYVVSMFLKDCDQTVVCGGTSSLIVARYLKKEIEVDFNFYDKDIPPMGHIDGIDLTTEGVLTLRRVLEMSKRYLSEFDLTPKMSLKKDGASLLCNLLFEKASHIRFFIGQAMNDAHNDLNIDIKMKLKIVESLAENLKKMGKNIEIHYD